MLICRNFEGVRERLGAPDVYCQNATWCVNFLWFNAFSVWL